MDNNDNPSQPQPPPLPTLFPQNDRADETANGTSDDDLIRVDVERVETEGEQPYTRTMLEIPRPPIWSTWILLFLSWFFLGSPAPFTVFIGLPLNMAALVLAVVSLARGGLKTGLLVLLLGTVGSFIVYMTGVVLFLGGAAAKHGWLR